MVISTSTCLEKPNSEILEETPGKLPDENDVPQEHGHHHHPGVENLGTDYTFKREIVWRNAVAFLILHLGAVYGLYLVLTFQVKFLTFLSVLLLDATTGEGITMGAHRLYSHKSFKAKFPLRLLLVTLQTMAGQNCMYNWVRDHRAHHKFSDTDADPHNANRGFFFSHIGWLLSKKHPLVKEKGKSIDMSDLAADKLVMFQKKYYVPLYFLTAIIFPVLLPVYAWGESSWNAFFTTFVLRYVLVLNQTWFVNSAAHLWGTKPFNKYIIPKENGFVAYITAGEGWHNYHHTFPWDYKASEYGARYNLTALFIDIFKFAGLAYDLRTVPYKMVMQRTRRTGDGCHPVYGKATVKTYRWGEEVNEDHNNVD